MDCRGSCYQAGHPDETQQCVTVMQSWRVARHDGGQHCSAVVCWNTWPNADDQQHCEKLTMRPQLCQLPVCPQPRPPALAPPGCRRGASTARGPAAAHPPSCPLGSAQTPPTRPEGSVRHRHGGPCRCLAATAQGCSCQGEHQQNCVKAVYIAMHAASASLFRLASLDASQQLCI